MVPWSQIDSVFLDMDGTLLDLAFDNFFWLERVPRLFAQRHGLEVDTAHAELRERYAQVQGTLDWYCIDHWSRELALDIDALKQAESHRVAYLPGAREFLRALRALGKRTVLVTNAHRRVLSIKLARVDLAAYLDSWFCSHELGLPKEDPDFWARLRRREPFDPARTLLVEDSLPVLRAAERSGLKHLIAVRRPDSRRPVRDIHEFPAVVHLGELICRMSSDRTAGAGGATC